MKRRDLLTSLMALVLLGHTPSLRAQDKKTFKPEELDQMLAPIALYSDALLAQMLMAASYPLEIVEAARWSKANPTLKGDAAVAAVKDKGWDVSVMSMVAFPDVLAQMSEQLTWTQKLGDAMLGQQQDVADSIQRLRARASAAGNLQTTPQQTVTTQGSGDSVQYIITPTNPDVYYAPSYNPSWAYGAWPNPAYPPYYYPPYGGVLATGMLWGLGIAAAGAIYGGWRWGGYGNSYANVNVNRAVNIDRNFDRNRIDGDRWHHAEHHRKGVAYRDDATRQRFGQQARPGIADRDQFRGRLESGGRPGGPGGPGRPGGPGGPGGPGRPGGPGQGLGGGAGGVQRPAARPDARPSALSGSNRGPQINNQSNRGRQQMNRAQSHGGGGRAGGGGRPGGGGGRPGGGGGGGGRPGGGGGGGGRPGGGGGGGGGRR